MALAAETYAAKNSKADILTLEVRIPVPSPGLQGAWSANGRQIYLNQPWYGTLRVADLDKGEVLENPRSKHNAMENVASSPDGQFVVWVNSGEVRLLRASTLEDAGRLERDLNDCSFQYKYAMQFTSDSRFLWISCGYLVKEVTTYTAAVKIQIPEMKVVDRLTLTSPQPGESFSTWLGQIRRDGDKLQLISRVGVSTPYAEEKRPPNGPTHQGHYYYYGYDLESKSELFPPISLDALGFENYSPIWETYFGKYKILVIEVSGTEQTKIVALDGSKGTVLNFSEKGHYELPYRMLSSADGRYLFGGTVRPGPASPGDPQSLGSLLVLDPRSLELLQDTFTGRVHWLEISPDGSHLATLSEDYLSVFRISQ